MASVANPPAVSNPPALARHVPVLLPLPLKGVLDYAVPDGMDVSAGDIVLVPLNFRPRLGVVWDGDGAPRFDPAKLKPITQCLGPFRLEKTLRQFVDWVAAYTLSPPGDVLAMALRASALAEVQNLGLRRSPAPGEGKLTEARARVLALVGEETLPATEIARSTGVSAAIIRAMVRSRWLEQAALPPSQPSAATEPAANPAALNPEQASAAAALVAAVTDARYSVTLLQGATGSGKTEVYFEAIRACIHAGRQALVLLPEIALSAQWLLRFEQSFGAAAAVWHSGLPPRLRDRTWRAAADGQARVVVGARSALFLPFANLGLIVVDEEHDTAFKQEDGVIYHARDMAVVRARFESAAAVLVSATPSLETEANAQAGRYRKLALPSRYGGAALPRISAIDLRQHPPVRGAFLSPVLLAQIQQTLDRGEQAMLFLNRRGYAPLTLCRACGARIVCPNCTAWLVEHRLSRTLVCHHCGHTRPIPQHCAACGAEGSLSPIGPGVERIAEEVAACLPEARRLLMTSDTLAGPNRVAAAVAAIEARKVDLIIGTQIVAKGWHFPALTLVGVVDADLGLAGGDLRAGERTMQLLHQVAGRAGRESAPGSVLVQTYQPQHPVLQALVAADLEGFMRLELAQRREGNWPPHGRLAAVIVSAKDEVAANLTAQALGRAAPRGSGFSILGPAPAPLALLRGRHRRRLLLRADRTIPIQALLRAWLGSVAVHNQVRIDIDIDPVSFL
jgi:primosomal protein N' (replication factor Y)